MAGLKRGPPIGKTILTGSRRSGVDNTITGSTTTPNSCSCKRSEKKVKEIIRSALKLVRKRFALSNSELPELELHDLDKYLLKLLDPSGGPPLPFPRRIRGSLKQGTMRFVRLDRKSRWTLAQSCASIKRSIVFQPCEDHPPPSAFPSWRANACQANPPSSDPEYLKFIRSVIRREFQFGWDKGLYESFCYSFVPKPSNRAEKRACGVPWSSDDWWSKHSTRQDFLSATLAGKDLPYLPPDFVIRYKEVATNGKVRPLGVPSIRFDLLGPLHKAVYQHLTKKKWLLRGLPSEARLKSVCQREWNTSVDLVAATDGLKIDAAEAILGALLAKASSIPGRVREMAMSSLRPKATADGEWYDITHGQMMGSYLSFPLLCLQSYCAARWATRDLNASYLVNGDDTLINCDHRDVLNNYPEGFKINKQKTKVARNVAEINSTTFLKTGKRWGEIRHLRRGGGLSDWVQGLGHLASACTAAGPKWVSAFIHAGFTRRAKVDPADLGLDTRNHDVWRQHSAFRRNGGFRRWPVAKGEKDPRLVNVGREPNAIEVEELRQLLFTEGRYVPDAKKPQLVSKLPLTKKRKVFQGFGRKPGYPDYVFHKSYLDALRLKAVPKQEVGFVVADSQMTEICRPRTKEINGEIYLVCGLWW